MHKHIDIPQFVQNVGKKNGWEVTWDTELLAMLIEGLETNLERFGFLQCPCRLSWGEREKDRDITCPCTYAIDDIAEFGHCFCSLFLSSAFAQSHQEPISIPERREEELFP